DIEADPNARGGVGILKGERIDENWNWTVFTQTHGLYDLYIGSLVMHPTNPDILLAGAGNLECSGTGPDGYFSGGTYLTTNGGLSWSHTLTKLEK
ncbi:MAG: hypothetical protein GWN00_08285, partial [Aliifodinibius sp.]|nr:hypothetical protein [candidate division Zixibacteria bacterium]NIT56224.1 hypothetical protein [Fodinibius sp.]NIW44337.1 hypothetical protein [Gammaproteobacteria bacterium]NIR63390.1 hypothetical protein [candidate division Zixibacteria bacterium]NIS45381.1 hypothetical protein [candidate division Zixibacteria bacterium]